MKLYNIPASPFAARVRILLRAKGQDMEMLTPPAPAEFRQITPLGKVPVLLRDDGSVLPESEVICHYLDDILPGPKLYPVDTDARAASELIVRLADLYFAVPLSDFFTQLFTAPDDRAAMQAIIPDIARGLKYLDLYVGEDGFAAAGRFTHADCALPPMLFYAGGMLSAVAGDDLLAKRPRLSAYWQAIQQQPAVQAVLEEMRQALKKYQSKLQAAQ
jgi:glutathione S-transferase